MGISGLESKLLLKLLHEIIAVVDEISILVSVDQLFIVDWELAQIGHRAYDLGQMIGDLYERKHFNDVDCALWIMEGFISYLLVLDARLNMPK